MKKIIITVLIIILAILAVIGCATLAYSKSDDYKSDRFSDNTQINGIDCSGLTYDQAEKKLTEKWNAKHIVVTGPLSDDLAEFTNFDCTYKIQKSLKNAKKHGIVLAAMNHFIKTPLTVQFPMTVDKYGEECPERGFSQQEKCQGKPQRIRGSFKIGFSYSLGNTRHEA